MKNTSIFWWNTDTASEFFQIRYWYQYCSTFHILILITIFQYRQQHWFQVHLRKSRPNTNNNMIWSWVLSLHNLAPLYLSNSTSVCCFFYGAFTATGKLCYFAQTNEICYVQKFSTRLRIEGKVLLQHTCWMKTLFRYLLTYTKNHSVFISYFLDACMKKDLQVKSNYNYYLCLS